MTQHRLPTAWQGRLHSALFSLATVASAATVWGQPAQPPSAPPANPSSIEYVNAADAGNATVRGDSTMHKWSAQSTTINGAVAFAGDWTGPAAPQLRSIQLDIPVESLTGDDSGMNRSMHNALKMKDNPSIAYRLSSAALQSPASKDDPQFHYQATGQLTIAGYARDVNLTLDVLPGEGGKLTITTQTGLKMTDFGIDPPSNLFGLLKAADDVTVNVTWQLTRKQP